MTTKRCTSCLEKLNKDNFCVNEKCIEYKYNKVYEDLLEKEMVDEIENIPSNNVRAVSNDFDINSYVDVDYIRNTILENVPFEIRDINFVGDGYTNCAYCYIDEDTDITNKSFLIKIRKAIGDRINMKFVKIPTK